MVKHIWIEGIIQGVGFRPFVYKEAVRLGLSGSVANKGGAVEIIVSGKEKSVGVFLQRLKKNPPEFSKIEKLTVSNASGSYNDFLILESEDSDPGSFIPNDLGLCLDCEKEILDRNNSRRFRHCFTGCVKCGPRFTALKFLPYDRQNTVLFEFPLCEDCQREYKSPKNRRYSAENNCCQNCGPELNFYQKEKNINLKGENALKAAAETIKSGGVIAVKGIGGYHLCCSPYMEKTVIKLREIKNREAKPFAVMFPDITAVKKICALTKKERVLLSSPARPIVLLSVKNNLLAPSVLDGSENCGCFLPYTPLHRILTEDIGEIIFTSANLAGGTIILNDDEMTRFQKNSALDGILSHNRKIIRSAEDSVCQINIRTPQILRRSRGYSPGSFILPYSGAKFLAYGGDLKASFSVVKNKRACTSPYFGDLEDISSQNSYNEAISDFLKLYRAEPEFTVCDAHPNYFSSVSAKNMAKNMGIPVKIIQHHHAHAASVMAEHNISPDSRVIAAVFDGTGYGEDKTIWGGEFFVWQEGRFIRRGHLRYFDIMGADSASFDADKTALCYLDAYGINLPYILKKDILFAETVTAALKNKINVYKYSGAGRLFDALSAIIGLSAKNRYEGECAALFEKAAKSSRDLQNSRKMANKSAFTVVCKNGMYTADPFNALCLAAALPYDKIPDFAYGFHLALSCAIEKIVISLFEETGIKTVLLSGGVFQNRLLTDLTAEKIKKAKLKLILNSACPPNDNGLCLGQAYLASLNY